jgi:hypothetical protein
LPGRGTAVASGAALRDRVIDLCISLGLEARKEVKLGRRLWGAVRSIDVVITDPDTRRSLGLECKYQGGGGTAEEKIPATISDIGAWPIQGLVVFHGQGFSPNMRAYLWSTGKAVALDDLEDWLRLYFGID